MQILPHLRHILNQAEEKVEASHQSWKMHLVQIEEQQTRLKREHPKGPRVKVWASSNAVSGALARLMAYDEFMTQRAQALSNVCFQRPYLSVSDTISHIMERPPIGSETRAWRFITAVAEAQDRVDGHMSLLAALEKSVSQRFEKTKEFQQNIAETVESKDFAFLCRVAAKLELLEEFMDSLIEGNDNLALREKLEVVNAGVKATVNGDIGKMQREINRLHCRMARLGMQVARQTLIEYFVPLSV